jgi:hypothetical protein
MSRFDRATQRVALLLSVLALVVASGAGTAYAAGKITAKQIKSNAITTAKIKDGAVTGAKVANGSLTAADLAPGTIPAPTPAVSVPTVYWAYITQGGAVGRGTPGVTAEAQLNGGYWQYRVTFPSDVSNCGYQVSSGDGAALGSNEFVIPARIGVARSTQGPRVLVVNVYEFTNGTSIQDTFFVTVTC